MQNKRHYDLPTRDERCLLRNAYTHKCTQGGEKWGFKTDPPQNYFQKFVNKSVIKHKRVYPLDNFYNIVGPLPYFFGKNVSYPPPGILTRVKQLPTQKSLKNCSSWKCRIASKLLQKLSPTLPSWTFNVESFFRFLSGGGKMSDLWRQIFEEIWRKKTD